MGSPWSLNANHTCPKCKKENALSVEITDEQKEQEQIDSGQQGLTSLYTTTLHVNVNCKHCGLLGFTSLSKSVEGGSRVKEDRTLDLWGAQDFPAIDPDHAIGIVVDRFKNPKYRRVAPW